MARTLNMDSRRAMIDAARSIITNEGVRTCTVDEVARRTGIAKTTIYRHFGGSDALVLAAVDGMVKTAEPPDTGSLQGDLMVIMRRYVRIARAPAMRELYGWMMTRSMEDPEFAAMFRDIRVQGAGPTVLALQRAMARGEVAADLDIPLAMHFIQGPFANKRIVEGDAVSDTDLETMVGWLAAGLRSSA